ncbi:MAG: CHAD domain-containing protein [Nocardioides sp.]
MPLGEVENPPPELLDRVRVLIRDAPVAPSAVLVTRRRVHRLLGKGGVVLAELCDDQVTGTTSSELPTVEEWREWELELVDAPAELLDAAEPVLIRAGARPTTAPSKVARVLAESLPTRPSWQERRALDSRPTAGELLSAYVADNLTRLERQDQLLRSGDHEGVHQLRVAARRLRSALTTYAPIVEPDTVIELRAELKWFGGVLSQARDAQVLRRRLSALVEQQPAELVVGPVVDRISGELQESFRTGRVQADEALDGERYFRLIDRLEAFLETPPFRDAAGSDAREVVPHLVQAELDRLCKRDRAHRRARSGEARDLALHEVRKSAKRLRYAAETAEPVFPKRATGLAAVAEALQEVLGEHQDSVVSRTILCEIGARAHADGESAFTFGLLHAVEACGAAELEHRYEDVLADLPRKDLGVWLRK